jgi:HTH-type transcriptional regulator / antitoxin MqsA
MPSPETGQVLMRGVRPSAASYKGETLTIERPDDFLDGGRGGVHVDDDMSMVDAALRILKETVDRVPTPATIRRIRTKQRLSHRQAGALLQGSANTFDKNGWELAESSGPTVQLTRVLDRRPELADELR